MDYQEFSASLIRGVQNRLESGWVLKLRTISRKDTAKIRAVSVYQEDRQISPWIYMAPFYHMFSNGSSLEEQGQELWSIIRMTTGEKRIPSDVFIEFASAAPYLGLRLMSFDENKEFLKQVPHRRYLDLAVICQLMFPCGEDAMGSAVVYRQHMRLWQVTEDILFDTALTGMQAHFPAVLTKLEDYLQMGGREGKPGSGLYILSNSRSFFGAASLLYPGSCRRACEKLGGSFYILPSSVHEVLLLGLFGQMTDDQLRRTVCEVNNTELLPQEVLSGQIYFYDHEKDQVSIR